MHRGLYAIFTFYFPPHTIHEHVSKITKLRYAYQEGELKGKISPGLISHKRNSIDNNPRNGPRNGQKETEMVGFSTAPHPLLSKNPA